MAKIIGCNSNINKIIYSGYTITKVYACGGELVYSAEPTVVCDDHKLKYKYQGGDWQYREYNGNYTLDCYDTAPNNCTGQVTTIVSSTGIGKCVNAIDDYTLRGAGIMTIPSEVAWIGAYALADNGNSVITFEGLQPPIIQSTTFYNSTGKIIVPCEAVNRYKSAWSSLSSRISATTSCTQLPIITGDGFYDYIEIDSTHHGSFSLDLTSLSSPKVEIVMEMVEGASVSGWEGRETFLQDTTNNWETAIYSNTLGIGKNGNLLSYFSHSKIGLVGTLTIEPTNIGYLYEGCSNTFAISNLVYGNSSSNAHIKLYSVKVYNNNTLRYE